jgi:hypothetical protein
MDKV